jgi:membrane protein DedA with SNARE-associated domain
MRTSLLAGAAGTSHDLTGLVGWIADVIAMLGPLGVGLMVALENVFPPIPSEIVLPFAGFVAARGGAGAVVMTVAATLGSVGGAVVLYEAGRRLGRRRARALLCRVPLVEPEEVDRAVDWFGRNGRTAVFTGRFVPVVRSLVSLPAGADRMPRGRFLLLTTVGSAIWNAIWVGAGYALGSRWESLTRYSDLLNAAFWGFVVLALVRFVWRRRDRLATSS